MAKRGVTGRADTVRFALRRGWLEEPRETDSWRVADPTDLSGFSRLDLLERDAVTSALTRTGAEAVIHPTNPYGETKRAFEKALRWYAGAFGLSSASLRYFNAAGATRRNGERHSKFLGRRPRGELAK